MAVTLAFVQPRGLESQRSQARAFPQAKIDRGEYLARAGDCVACHTAARGTPFAGGLPFKLPIGTVYSTNITPDPQNGIGLYTLDAFDRAVRSGVARDGHPLYPAMPFPSYSRITRPDIEDLYAYFMQGVAPVAQVNRQNDMSWPLSIRWPLNFWRWAFAPAQQLTSATSRGAYLVEGLGHCGACHTPRGFGLQEKALSDNEGLVFLSGAVVDGWAAKSLRGEPSAGLGSWSEEEIVIFLASGHTARSAVFGPMTDVVDHSTQFMRPDDLRAIAHYLKSLAAADAADTKSTYSDAMLLQLRAGNDNARGGAVYIDNCAACHRTDGKGYAGVFPALAQNSAVVTPKPASVIRIVLAGSRTPATAKSPAAFAMPGFAWRLSDAQIADVATFVRTSWGNAASPVDADSVGDARRAIPGNSSASPHR